MQVTDREESEDRLYTIRKAVTEVNQYNGANQLVSSRRTESAGSAGDADGLGGGKGSGKGGFTEYLYDQNGNRIRELKNGEEDRSYAYDTENRLIAVRDRKGLLMAALYDGDGSRVFTANRTEDTKAYQLFAEKKVSDRRNGWRNAKN